MEFIIIKCPHCDEPVSDRVLSDSSTEEIKKRANNDMLECFNLIKKVSKEAYEKNQYNKLVEEMSKDITDLKNYIPKADVSLGTYLLALKERLKATKNPADLHKLRKEMVKSKVVVKRPLKKEFERQKKKFIVDIDKKIKGCKKSQN